MCTAFGLPHRAPKSGAWRVIRVDVGERTAGSAHRGPNEGVAMDARSGIRRQEPRAGGAREWSPASLARPGFAVPSVNVPGCQGPVCRKRSCLSAGLAWTCVDSTPRCV
jgi:hypothetical protein